MMHVLINLVEFTGNADLMELNISVIALTITPVKIAKVCRIVIRYYKVIVLRPRIRILYRRFTPWCNVSTFIICKYCSLLARTRSSQSVQPVYWLVNAADLRLRAEQVT